MRQSRDGITVVSAGVSAAPYAAPYTAMGAYVLATYGPEARGTARGAVSCDVVLEDDARTRLRAVPVVVLGSGGPVVSAGAWRPTPARRNLDTGAALSAADLLPGDLSALDGDRVLVLFLGGALAGAVIVSGLAHPRVPRGRAAATPWTSDDAPHPVSPDGDARWMRHGGTEVCIDAAGNVALDTTAAPQTSTEEDPGTRPAGSVAINLRSDATLTLRWADGATALRVAPGPGGAPVVSLLGGSAELSIGDGAEVAVRGNALRAWLTAVRTWLATHVHTASGSGGPTTTPTVAPPAVPAASTLLASRVKLPGV